MCICKGCGKVIENKFFYCPWCGYSRVENKTETGIELGYRQHCQKQLDNRLIQLQKMNDQLDQLEEELSVLVLSTQMAK